jgi:DNA mismatch repair ATPase MutL
VRSSIRRLFTGEISEILGELLQNSQRARATDVTITTHETGFTYTDNGHGLLGDVKPALFRFAPA